MLTIEEIKAAVPYADGWTESVGLMIAPDGCTWAINDLMGNEVYFTNFKNRVIEGMNREAGIKITTDDIGIYVYVNGFMIDHLFSNYPSIDHAKAACISKVLRMVKG